VAASRFQAILVSIDGSADAANALIEAIDLAEAGHGRLTIITAVQIPYSLGEAGIGGCPPQAPSPPSSNASPTKS